MAKVTCFGEVLWDVFPEQKKIGGAPLNVANRLRALGNDVALVSAIGRDENGTKLLDYINGVGIDSKCIQINTDFPTGDVQVILNDKGSASYDIKYPRAWDKIGLTEENITQVKNSDAFVFGSLVARDNQSKNTLLNLIELAQYKIFDLNLRPPHYTPELLIQLMHKADFIKFNDDELYEVSALMGSKFHSLEQNLMFISEHTQTTHVCVTKGSHGAVLLYNDTLYYNSGFSITVKDTVGAGDSFLGSLISQLLNGSNPQEAINFACAVGALVAQSDGANPTITEAEISRFMNP